eukprot:1247390-Heterocapsa_arctica.AAC.1
MNDKDEVWSSLWSHGSEQGDLLHEDILSLLATAKLQLATWPSISLEMLDSAIKATPAKTGL